MLYLGKYINNIFVCYWNVLVYMNKKIGNILMVMLYVISIWIYVVIWILWINKFVVNNEMILFFF